jgi:hypothetical protein
VIKLNIESELPTAIKWTNEHTKQLPYSIANALNTTVQGSNFVPGSKEKSALKSLANQSTTYLDRPKASTQKGWRATRAKKRNLSTTILPKDKPYNQQRYLGGSATGGSRAPKDFGAALMKHPLARNIPGGSRLVPTPAMKRDKYGNVSKTQINKLFDQANTSYYQTNSVFIGKPRGGNRPPGVYRRSNKNRMLTPLFYAVSNVRYGARFPAERIVGQTIQRQFGVNLRQELAKNVAKNVKAGRADTRTGIF